MARSRSKKNAPRPRLELTRETIQDLLALLLAFLGILLLLANFNWAGPLGVPVGYIFRRMLGLTAYVMPVVFLIWSLALIWPDKVRLGFNSLLGAALSLTALSALFSVFSSDPGAGGFIGYVVAHTGLAIMTLPLTAILLIFILLAGLIIALDRPLRSLLPARDEEATGRKDRAVVINQADGAPRIKTKPEKQPKEETAPVAPPLPSDKDWQPFPLDLLEPDQGQSEPVNVHANIEVIKQTLGNFGIRVEMHDVNVGPTVTQYTLKPDEGVKLTQITGLANDLSLALAAHPIRIEAPIPGKSLVGIEVPNNVKSLVRMRGLLTSPAAAKHVSRLDIPLGRAVAGDPVFLDITSLPHLLIAGQTNAGKSVAINSMLISLLYKNSPRDMRLILVDPKRVELAAYNGLPHLLTPVIVEPGEAISALKWSIGEMDRRFKVFAAHGNRNLDEFNRANREDYLPHIVVVIDELATLMQLALNEVEALIIRLAQMSRATGIHLVLATQRPESNVITGLIKANIPARIAFAVASQIDSRIVLDTAGAEKLLGKGDMLYMTAEMSRPRRVQGVYISEKETTAVTNYLKQSGKTEYHDEVLAQPVKFGGKSSFVEADSPDDDLFDEAAEEVIRQGKASASLLQRRLRVGYARAARLLDLLEERGIIGPGEGAKPRDVLVDSYDGDGDSGVDEEL